MDGLVVLAFEDGRVGMGVWKEAVFMRGMGRQVLEIKPDNGSRIEPFDFDESRRLSVVETQMRVRPQD